MSNQFVDQLIGETITASIGEPWNFKSESGQNRLTGNIVHIVFDQENHPFILCKVSPFIINEKKRDHVVAVNRYIKTQNILENLSNFKPIVANMIYFDEVIQHNEIVDTLAKNKNMGFLIGTIYREKQRIFSNNPSDVENK